MKYVDEFRDSQIAAQLVEKIHRAAAPQRQYRFMEFCGGHTHAIFRYGLPDLLPDNVTMVHGPGCPVCVLPIQRLDLAIEMAVKYGVILCSYGDMLRVPGSRKRSLQQARADGVDIRMVYSCADALRIAEENSAREVVFFAIGFETTTPPTALVLQQAKKKGIRNFSVYCNHVLTPAAISFVLDSPDMAQLQLDGFVGPAHVSTVIGTEPYEYFARHFHKPVVIAGFEPLDLLQAILMLIRQVNAQRAEVENEYARAVTAQGNMLAQEVMKDVFTLRPNFEWRGLGEIPNSALQLSSAYAEFDAEKRFAVNYQSSQENRACQCGAVLRGVTSPDQCSLFADPCTPDNPLGSCMVSSEGACAAYYRYGRFQNAVIATDADTQIIQISLTNDAAIQDSAKKDREAKGNAS